MNYFKVKEVEKMLNVSHATVYRKVKILKKPLKGLIKKKQKVLFLSEKAIEIIEKNLKNNLCNSNESKENKNSINVKINENMNEKTYDHKNEIKYVESLENELKKRDHIMEKMMESQEKDKERQAQERERTDIIIMKLTQDLEKIRNENQLLLESVKKSKEQEKENPKKEDPVISIEEYINKKLEEEKEKSNFESEKKRLKKQYSNPLQGKSKLYQFYIKLFHPEKLRKNA